MSAALELDALERRFGGHAALDRVSLAVEPGAFFCLLGPSGCGKTTLLRLIGGYLAPDAGRVVVAGVDVTSLPPERRGVGMVFQNYALFPHLCARDNVAFGLAARSVSRDERARRVDAMLDRVGIGGSERTRRPRELSGGQQQRVALARALVIEPTLLLLDEPLANLDRRLREQMRGELRDLQRRTNVTTVLVTHDQEEALALATQVGVMFAGRLLQVGTPDEIYDRPRQPFVARFVGDANVLAVTRREVDHVICGDRLAVEVGGPVAAGDRLLVRPERVLVGAAAANAPRVANGVVRSAAFLGVDRLLDVELAPTLTIRARVRGDSVGSIAVGDVAPIAVARGGAWRIPEPDAPWLLDREKERRDDALRAS